MDKLTVLFIRACKSKDPIKRLRSIYRRFFYSDGSDKQAWTVVSRRLIDICKDYGGDRCMEELVDGLNPANDWKYGEGEIYQLRVTKVLLEIIRFKRTDEFPGLPLSARWRNMEV